MQEIIINIMNQLGYLGIALLIAIENIFPPIPSEVILTFGGFMTTYSKITIIGAIISSLIGSVIGAIILYYIGRLLNKERLTKIVNGKLGKTLGFKIEHIEKAQSWFDKKGNYTVLFCRFIPIVRSLISIPAGMANMNFMHFIILTTIGSGIWNTVLVSLGAIAGASWEKIADYVSSYSRIVFIILIIVGIGLVLFKYRKYFIKLKNVFSKVSEKEIENEDLK